jgi:hypothetical protein
MAGNDLADRFRGIFRGNPRFFVRHQPPFTEHEGKLTAARLGFAVYNKRRPPPEGRETGDFIPVTPEMFREHLNGRDGLALAPLTDVVNEKTGAVIKANVCYYAAIDIDVFDTDFKPLVRNLYRDGFRFAACLSKSGGLHVYFFFSDAEPAKKAVEALEKIVAVYGLDKQFVSRDRKSKVEIFPKQTELTPGKHAAGCLFLPYYNAANKGKCKNKMLTAEGKLAGIEKALSVIEDMFTSVKEINETLERLPYSDAPYCVQVILLAGALGANDGRNNFLFSAAIYLKKKYGDNFYEKLADMNGRLEAPLEKRDIDSIYKSVTDPEKSYDNYSCGKLPCSEYCDKELCKTRKYGKKAKGGYLTGAECWGLITKHVAEGGDEPYYEWEVRARADEEFKRVRFDSEKELQTQAIVQQKCMRYLSWAPFIIKQNEWIAILNKAAEGMEKERTVVIPRLTDTSDSSLMRKALLEHLIHRRIKEGGSPLLIWAGQVYYSEGVYYFSAEGYMESLRVKKFNTGRLNMRDRMQKYGCAETVYTCKNSKGTDVKIPCWMRKEDDEMFAAIETSEYVYEGYRDAAREDTETEEKEDADEETKF